MPHSGFLLCFVSLKNCKIVLLLRTRLQNIHPHLAAPPEPSDSSHRIDFSLVCYRKTCLSLSVLLFVMPRITLMLSFKLRHRIPPDHVGELGGGIYGKGGKRCLPGCQGLDLPGLTGTQAQASSCSIYIIH